MISERYFKVIAFECGESTGQLINSVEGHGLIARLRERYKLVLIPSIEKGGINGAGFII